MSASLFNELKRRNVFRVGFAYLVVAWLLAQVADLALGSFEAPGWVIKSILLLLALGFPLALFFAWAFELTPEGLKREREVDRTESVSNIAGRKQDFAIIGLMAIALAYFVGTHDWNRHGSEADRALAELDKSIAVLAFQDLSADGDQAYFAEGLSEELLNVLAQVKELKVAGRTSSFAFKGQNTDLREIGEILNVAHILEGSVRKDGSRIRVTAQLSKAIDGFNIFSETYDRNLSDVFAVQDEIAQSISSALLTEIAGIEPVEKAAATDPVVFEIYLQARQRIRSRDADAMHEASTMLDRALEMDPDYAPAIAQKALVTYLLSDSLGTYGDIPLAQTLPLANSLVEKALALDDQLAEAHAIQGLLANDGTESALARAHGALTRALELNPTMSNASNWLHRVLLAMGKQHEAREVLERVVERDPMYGPAFNNLISTYVRTGDFDKADVLISRVARIVGEDGVNKAVATVALMRGDSAMAVRQFEREYQTSPNKSAVRAWYGWALFGIADFETILEIGRPDHRLLAAGALGDHDEARRILEGLDPRSGVAAQNLESVGQYLLARGRHQDFLDFTEQHFETLDKLLTSAPVGVWNTRYLGDLAYAYRQSNNEEALATVIEAMRNALAAQGAAGTNNWSYDFSRAELAALTGDRAAALVHLQTAIDSGYRYILALDSPIFDPVRDDPKFVEMKNSLRSLVDEQRAELGMSPYRTAQSASQ